MSAREIVLRVERYSFADEPQYTGSRGTRVEAETGYENSRVFASTFPSLYVTDSGVVEGGDGGTWQAEDLATYLRLVADHIDARVAENKAAGR